MRNFRFLYLFLLAFVMLAIPASTPAQVAVGVGISVHIGPPPLRVVAVQPICPGPDYIWTPGYWAYGDAGYYWVPGAWVIAPQPGLLWTPGYWGWGGGVYAWHRGYWGPHVGFYGGINYGFGYGGVGFVGGEWRGGHFFYNTAVAHVNVNIIHNTYINRTVIVHNDNHMAFNGPGGVRATPTREEMAAEHEQHFEATHEQTDHRDMASSDHRNFARPQEAGRKNFNRSN
ncbi:MAG: YXWGXW repeat-containing protein, partial [Candidatus Acidiferrales bacterium]